MSVSSSPGTSVDLPSLDDVARSLRLAIFFDSCKDNLSTALLLQGKADSTGRTKQSERYGSGLRSHYYNDPDSLWTNSLREQLRNEVGENFTEIAYKVINMIPDADWMEFARNALRMDDEDLEVIRECSSPTTDMKYNMIKRWEKSRKRADQDATGEFLLKLAFEFLTRKGHASRIVQQNFNGPIHAQTVNGFVTNQGPGVQASA